MNWKKAIRSTQYAICLLLTTVAFADTHFYASASASETNVFLGQVFNVDVVVKADKKPDLPKAGKWADFNITVLADGQPTSATNTWLYRFALRATREGELILPSLDFGPVATDALHITAKKPVETDRMKLAQSLSKTSVYLGEPVLLTTTWDSTYQFGAIKAVDLHFPIFNDKRFQLLELYEPQKGTQEQTTGLPVHGTRVLATRRSYASGEVQHQSLAFDKLLIPKQSGEMILLPATLLCAVENEKDPKSRRGRSAFQYPSYFDNTFFDQNVTGGNWARIYTESEPLTLNVKPLPTKGRPALFNGMVGDYTLTVEAEPTTVRVGDPVTLKITVTAAEFMENIFFQPLRYQPLLINRFDIPSDRSLPLREGKSKIYTQTIRPLSSQISQIPPLQLAFFSPASNAYITVESAPIGLSVSPAEQIGVFGGNSMQHRLHAVEEGIRHNYEHPDMLESRRLPLLGWAQPLAVLAILLLPPLVVGGYSLVSLFGEKKHQIHRTAKAARAYKVFRRNAASLARGASMKSDIYTGLDRVLRAYLGDRLHLNPGALSFRDAQTQLTKSGIDIQTLEGLHTLFALCEAYRFTSAHDEPGNAKQILRNAIRIVKSVERKLK